MIFIVMVLPRGRTSRKTKCVFFEVRWFRVSYVFIFFLCSHSALISSTFPNLSKKIVQRRVFLVPNLRVPSNLLSVYTFECFYHFPFVFNLRVFKVLKQIPFVQCTRLWRRSKCLGLPRFPQSYDRSV